MNKSVKEYLASLGRKGGAARAARLSPDQRRAQARKAAKARWSKKSVDKKK